MVNEGMCLSSEKIDITEVIIIIISNFVYSSVI